MAVARSVITAGRSIMRVVTNPPPGSAATELSQASSGATTQPRHATAQSRPDPVTSKNSTDSRPPCCTTRSWSAPSARVDRWTPCGLNAARERPRTGRIPPAGRGRAVPGAAPEQLPALVGLEHEQRQGARHVAFHAAVLADENRFVARQGHEVFGVGEGADGPRRPFRLAGRHRLRLGGVRRGGQRRQAGDESECQCP